MARLSSGWRALVRITAPGAVLLVAVAGVLAQPPFKDRGQPPEPGPGQVYQRYPVDGHAFDGHRLENWRNNREARREFRRESPRVSAGWFERPYPDHLDFFRMRFGSRVGALETPYGPTLPAYYGPYYTGAAPQYASPYRQVEQGGALVEVPDDRIAPASGEPSESKSTETLPMPAPSP